MGAYRVEHRPEAFSDLEEIPANIQNRILRAVEQRLETHPEIYGTPLAHSLEGLWKIRVGDYRVVYEIKNQLVTIWAIRHRSGVYQEASRRWARA